jgi:hypothetical protein
MKKIILAVIVLLAAGGFYAYSQLGGELKAIIESAGTQAMGTKVSVGSVDVSIATEAASISSLKIDNPPGFSGNFLETKSITATLGGIENKTVTIKEIVIDGLNLTYDLGPGGTNFDVLKRNLKASSSATPAPTSSAKPSAKESASGGAESGGYDVIIQQLKIENAKVNASIAGRSQTITLPGITLNNIGSKDHPATPEQVARQIMQQLLAVSSGAATKLGLSSLPIPANAGKAKDMLKGFLSK